MNEARVARREALVERKNSRDLIDRRCRRFVGALAAKPLRFLDARLAPRACQPPIRHAVTLIELLIVITIITILSAAFLGASRSAMELSRSTRTKSTISKIHTLLMERWASYATRRVDLNLSAQTAVDAAEGADKGRMLADFRLLGIRELMKLEMPDRWSDVTLNGIPVPNPQSIVFNNPTILGALPPLTSAYRRRFLALRSKDGATLDGNKIAQHQGAECLYMIVMLSTGDGEARSLFREQDIGDADGDGAPEFLDGWGNPIDFIRWPAGFWERSDLIGGPNFTDQDHDPFDPFRRDQIGVTLPSPSMYPTTGSPKTLRALVNDLRVRNNSAVLELPDGSMAPVGAFRLVPLVFSSGSDGISDINASPGFVTDVDPYAIDSSEPVFQFGVPADGNNDGDDNSVDNIHNHLQDNK